MATPLFLITGGGTGGHVYPGLAVADALCRLDEGCHRVLFVGTRRGLERELVTRARLPFLGVASGALRGRGPLAKASSGLRLACGIGQSLAIVHEKRPAAILATGGYVSAPVVLAGWLARVPVMIYLPDVEPGLAIKFLSHFARLIAVTSEESRRFLPANKVVVTGYPLRPELLTCSREEGRKRLGLSAEDRVLLVIGGSRGAHSINVAVADALPELLATCTVIHVCGAQDEAWLQETSARLPENLAGRYRPFAYLHEELSPAMAAADLAISRAGASVIGEYPLFGLPAILVPYPYAGGHQERNADFLVSKGAALKLLDQDLERAKLAGLVKDLLGDAEALASMRASAQAIMRPGAAQMIARELEELCSVR